MRMFFWIQAFYCLTGILFFVRDLFAKVPMGQAMVNAFIWPYAQWQLMKAYAVYYFQVAMAQINNLF